MIEQAPDLSTVRGLALACEALTVAAAGGHSLLLHGPAGSGKSMLARRLVGLLPDLIDDELAEVAALERTPRREGDRRPPNRAPHSTASERGLFGHQHAGECSLAHRGVLIFDDLPELGPAVLQRLRCVLETRETYAVVGGRVEERPASFRFVATTRLCPCGLMGHPDRACKCSAEAGERYRARLEEALPCFSLAVPVLPATVYEHAAPSSASVRERVARAIAVQRERSDVAGLSGRLNAHLSDDDVDWLPVDGAATDWLDAHVRDVAHRPILRIARTLADLEPVPSPLISLAHARAARMLRQWP